MNLPNKLTMMRVIMVPFFMVFAAMSRMGTLRFNATYALIAGILFAVASFTDFLDGYLARKNHLVTDFGKFMDPLADKMLTTAAIIYMVVDGVCSPVVLAIIMFREFAVAGVRMIAAESGTVIAANMWGKVKTVLQMVTIIFYYFAAALAGPTDVGVVSLVTVVLCWLCGAATRRTALGLSALPPRCCAGPLLPLPHFPAASTCGRIVPALCRQNDAAPLQPLIRAAIINLNGLQV